MYFFWVDCEMTGLNIEKDHILELAAVITDKDMNVIVDYHTVINQSDCILSNMDDWCRNTHEKSGLLSLVKNSDKNYNIVEKEILDLLYMHCDFKNTFIAGNSVYNDLWFIKKYIPKVADFLHYRIFDISTFKILAFKNNINPFVKFNKHNAKDDIMESMSEFLYYQERLFIFK